MKTTLEIIIWVFAIGLAAILTVRAQARQNYSKLGFWIVGLVILASALTILSTGIVFIRPEERGVVLSSLAPKGYREQALGPGIHWIAPLAEQVILYPISRQTYTMTTRADANISQIGSNHMNADGDTIIARTRDGQEVSLDISVIYAVNPDEVVDLHIKWQTRYTDQLVRPTARSIVREAASHYGTDEIVSARRGELEEQIREKLSAKLKENNLVLVDFFLRDIRFSQAYASAIEQKQITEQQAIQTKSSIEQKKMEAELARQSAKDQAEATIIAAEATAKARLLEAQAEADANKLMVESVGGPQAFIQYLYIQKIPAGIKTIIVPGDTQFTMPLPAVAE
jgi:regulator of protease activity HflC (stomatin/prohibitin superfamily)